MIDYDDDTPMIQWQIAQPPKPVGHWRLGHGETYYTKFVMYKKPTDKQIENTEELLGWKWIDE